MREIKKAKEEKQELKEINLTTVDYTERLAVKVLDIGHLKQRDQHHVFVAGHCVEKVVETSSERLVIGAPNAIRHKSGEELDGLDAIDHGDGFVC